MAILAGQILDTTGGGPVAVFRSPVQPFRLTDDLLAEPGDAATAVAMDSPTNTALAGASSAANATLAYAGSVTTAAATHVRRNQGMYLIIAIVVLWWVFRSK